MRGGAGTKLGELEYPIPKFSAVLPTRDTTGDFDEMCLAAGESAGLVRDVRPAASIVREMMDEARAIVEQGLPPRAGGMGR